jgi:hypothetical protein
VDQLVQITGSLLVLAGFAAAQAGRLDPKSLTYLTLNLVGSGVLAVEALRGHQWGFLLLEGVWAAVSLAALVALAVRRARRSTDGGPDPSYRGGSAAPEE